MSTEIIERVHEELLALLQFPLTLLCNECDRPLSTDLLNRLHSNPRIRAIYAHNFELDIDLQQYPKVRHLPLGYRANTTEGVLLGRFYLMWDFRDYTVMEHLRKHHPVPFKNKPLTVLCAIGKSGGTWTDPLQRQECIDYLKDKPFAEVLSKKTDPQKYYRLHDKCAFEISPMGNGVDCYRHYEALLLQTIPIVFDSYLNDTFRKLPVVIIRRPQDITEELLRKAFRLYQLWFEDHCITDMLALRNYVPPEA